MLESLVLVALGAAFLLGAYFFFETWLRVWEQQEPSPLARTLCRTDADPERLALPHVAREIALAERRCPTCPATGACREWLECATPSGSRGFCPNAALVERLTR